MEKKDEHHAPVVPCCLPQGWAVHLSRSPITTACGSMERSSLPCRWLTVLELIHAAGPGRSSVLSSELLFLSSPLPGVVLVCFRPMAQDLLLLQFKNPSSGQSNMLPTVLPSLKTKELFEEQL